MDVKTPSEPYPEESFVKIINPSADDFGMFGIVADILGARITSKGKIYRYSVRIEGSNVCREYESSELKLLAHME